MVCKQDLNNKHVVDEVVALGIETIEGNSLLTKSLKHTRLKQPSIMMFGEVCGNHQSASFARLSYEISGKTERSIKETKSKDNEVQYANIRMNSNYIQRKTNTGPWLR